MMVGAMKMELHEIIKELEITTPEDAKLTLCWIAGYLHERGNFGDFAEAFESSPMHPNAVQDKYLL